MESVLEYVMNNSEKVTNIMQEFFLSSIFVAVIVAFIWVGIRLHKNNSTFNVNDIFVDTKSGKASTSKIFAVVAGVTSTWFIFWSTMKATITPEYFLIYLGTWSGVKVASDIIKAKYGVTQTKEGE